MGMHISSCRSRAKKPRHCRGFFIGAEIDVSAHDRKAAVDGNRSDHIGNYGRQENRDSLRSRRWRPGVTIRRCGNQPFARPMPADLWYALAKLYAVTVLERHGVAALQHSPEMLRNIRTQTNLFRRTAATSVSSEVKFQSIRFGGRHGSFSQSACRIRNCFCRFCRRCRCSGYGGQGSSCSGRRAV